jgi:hypothetical protein
MDRWAELTNSILANPPGKQRAVLRHGSLRAVENIVGHTFKRPHFLVDALVRYFSFTAYFAWLTLDSIMVRRRTQAWLMNALNFWVMRS